MKVLVVEDSERLRRSLGQGLRRSGFTAKLAADGEEAMRCLDGDEYDAVVLDLLLPRRSGLDVLRELRRDGRDVHVLILSAKDQVADRIRGLEMGADDYMVKPFSFEELLARLNALIRRRYRAKSPTISLDDDVVLDTARKVVTVGGAPAHLTPSEYSVLELLAMRRGFVLTPGQILDHLHHGDEDVTVNALEVLISGLRRKIHRDGCPPVVQTRRGHGYIVE